MNPIRSADDLMALGTGYQRSMILFTALRLGLFEALSSGAAEGGTLARRVGADPRRLSILLNALAAMGLIRKRGSLYENGRAARDFLVGGRGGRASLLLHHLDCWADWTGLEKKIRGGRRGKAGGGDFHENFIRGMEDNARERAAVVARKAPLKAGQRLLDLGGGPGTYAVEWARRYPGARITLFDVPDTLRVTRKILGEKGASGLVELVEGDFMRDPLGGPYDLVWISQILHAYPEEQCVFLLRKVRRALAPGGSAAVQEFLLDESGAAPPGPAFFSVHMVAVTEGGRAYTVGEVAGMLEAAGFKEVRVGRPDPRGVGVVEGRL
jgi:hypothetical protein